jgi:hypothetical protein
VWEISPLPAFDPQTIHPVASRYTDCAIPGHTYLHGVALNQGQIIIIIIIIIIIY